MSAATNLAGPTEPRTRFEIPEDNMAMLAEKIEGLNRKAKRLKCPAIETRVTGTERRLETESWPIGEDEMGNTKFEYVKVERVYFFVEILGAAPVLPDWEFLGTLEHHAGGNIIRAVPGFDVPESYRVGGQACAHCQTVRARKNTFIVRNKVSGDVKQIGRNCLRDFLGHVSPQQLGLFAETLETLELCGAPGGGGSGERSVDTLRFLEMAAACVLKFGFVSRAAAQAYAEKSEGHGRLTPTSSETWENLFPSPERRKSGGVITPDAAACRLAQDALNWARAGGAGNSDYGHNLKITLSLDYLTPKHAGIAASAIGVYQKHLGTLAAREAKAKYGANSNHFGEVGKRDVFTLTVIGEHVFESAWSESLVLFRMQDRFGNLAVWFTGSGNLEIGKTYDVKATVKRHDKYKEINQTVLNRITVIREIETNQTKGQE